MLDMKKNTGAKVSALVGTTLALGTIFTLVNRSSPQTVADTSAPDAAVQSQSASVPSQPASDPAPASAAAQASAPVQATPTTADAAAPAEQPPPTATTAPPPQQVTRSRHTRTRSS